MTNPNILLIAIDSLRRDHMSLYGFDRLTTPHIDKWAQDGTTFTHTFSPHIPTTPAYASMLTGRDCFGTQVVGLRHEGPMRDEAPTLAEILRDRGGYHTACVGFTGNPASRGFDEYLNYTSWGDWSTRPLRKAENLNDVTMPLLDKLNAGTDPQPWFVMLRHMDPHSPYLPPAPYERMFYQGDECDPNNRSMDRCLSFKPFMNYFKSWMPPGISDVEYVRAQYHGAVAYMDACIAEIFQKLEALGVADNTIVVLNGDHGETLEEHEYWFDHHGLHDPNLVVPLVIKYPGMVPSGRRIDGFNQHKDLAPTLLELACVDQAGLEMEGRSLMRMVDGSAASFESEFYISECTWMRKHGWRTPQWKLIVALEPDFHFMPEVELYNLIEDPRELHNLADSHPDVVQALRARMDAFIAQRERDTGLIAPMKVEWAWHGHPDHVPFKSSQEAYDTQGIGSAAKAAKLQARDAKDQDRGVAGGKPDEDNPFGVEPYADLPMPDLDAWREMQLITVIGRGHGGTRAMSHTLIASGTFMGNRLNDAGDLLPPEDMYEACRLLGQKVKHLGGVSWDFSELIEGELDERIVKLLGRYLQSPLSRADKRAGWKIPETTLMFPYIARLLPNIKYIHWVRDPRDAILKRHVTDDLSKFDIPYEATDDVRKMRAISWKYQAELIKAVPKPHQWITVRFEDFVLRQEEALTRLRDYLGFPLSKIEVRPDAVGRWKQDDGEHDFDFLHEDMRAHGYV